MEKQNFGNDFLKPRSDHVPCDVLCMVLFVTLIIELLPTPSIVSVISSIQALLEFWISLRQLIGTGRLLRCYLPSW